MRAILKNFKNFYLKYYRTFYGNGSKKLKEHPKNPQILDTLVGIKNQFLKRIANIRVGRKERKNNKLPLTSPNM